MKKEKKLLGKLANDYEKKSKVVVKEVVDKYTKKSKSLKW